MCNLCDGAVSSTQISFCDVLIITQGALLTYFTDGEGRGVLEIFLGLKFWPKGFFLGL